MKLLTLFSRLFVGILFIISGLIKLNDPMGFSFKLEDYFAPSVLNFPTLVPYALSIALFLIIVEILLGVMLLLGYKTKYTLWSLFFMIVFFTFLTFYSAYFNKVTDCGCFGDAIKLTPWQSFSKDIILLIFILILLYNKRYVQPLGTTKAACTILAVSLLFCGFLVYYVINHLPFIDFRPYKIGKNIQEGMSIPKNAPKAIYEYTWTFLVHGKEEKIINTGTYPTLEGTFLAVETKEIKKGYEPPIHDFTIEREGEDLTEEMLQKSKLVVIVTYDLLKTAHEGFEKLEKLYQDAKAKKYDVIALTASSHDLIHQTEEKYAFSFPFYFCDATTLKTIIRSNPGILILEKGTVTQKVNYHDIDNLRL